MSTCSGTRRCTVAWRASGWRVAMCGDLTSCSTTRELIQHPSSVLCCLDENVQFARQPVPQSQKSWNAMVVKPLRPGGHVRITKIGKCIKIDPIDPKFYFGQDKIPQTINNPRFLAASSRAFAKQQALTWHTLNIKHQEVLLFALCGNV